MLRLPGQAVSATSISRFSRALQAPSQACAGHALNNRTIKACECVGIGLCRQLAFVDGLWPYMFYELLGRRHAQAPPLNPDSASLMF